MRRGSTLSLSESIKVAKWLGIGDEQNKSERKGMKRVGFKLSNVRVNNIPFLRKLVVAKFGRNIYSYLTEPQLAKDFAVQWNKSISFQKQIPIQKNKCGYLMRVKIYSQSSKKPGKKEIARGHIDLQKIAFGGVQHYKTTLNSTLFHCKMEFDVTTTCKEALNSFVQKEENRKPLEFHPYFLPNNFRPSIMDIDSEIANDVAILVTAAKI